MAREVWGTFSVADHLRECAFVAEILLYDRLVLPVPPARDEQAWERWCEQGWRPGAQREMIDCLRRVNPDLVWEIPWDEDREAIFAKRYESANAVARDTDRLAESRANSPDGTTFGMTREILYEYANDRCGGTSLPKDTWVEAMTAYPSFDSFIQDAKLDLKNPPGPENSKLSGVFGWEFFVPAEPGMEHLKLLSELAQFVREDKFSEKRRAFHEQRRKLIAEGCPNAAAVAMMNDFAADYARATKAIKMRSAMLNGFTVLGIAASVASSLAVPAAGLVGAFFAACRFAGDQWLSAPAASPEQKAGAMIHDARNWFEQAKNL